MRLVINTVIVTLCFLKGGYIMINCTDCVGMYLDIFLQPESDRNCQFLCN